MIMRSLIFPFMLLLSAIFSFEKWSFFYRSPIRSGMTRRVKENVDDENRSGMTWRVKENVDDENRSGMTWRMRKKNRKKLKFNRYIK